ncbi:MAG: hypothetical protein QM730_23850 [Anaerolineales bacterium]
MPAIDLSQPSEKQAQWCLILGILVWFLHLNIVNSLISVSCKWGRLNDSVAGMTRQQLLITLFSLLAVVLTLFFMYLSWRYWRSFQTERPTINPEMLEDTEKYARPLLAFIAMLLNCFFAVYILATLVSTFSLKVCGQV